MHLHMHKYAHMHTYAHMQDHCKEGFTKERALSRIIGRSRIVAKYECYKHSAQTPLDCSRAVGESSEEG